MAFLQRDDESWLLLAPLLVTGCALAGTAILGQFHPLPDNGYFSLPAIFAFVVINFLLFFLYSLYVQSLTFAWCGVGDLPNSYFLFFCFGILFMYLGAGLRQHSFKQLGGAFTIDVRVSKQQKVIDSGAYRYIRHPGYLAGILIMLGFGVAMSNLVAVVVMFSTSVFVYSRRIHFEEKAMLEQLGSNYSN